MGHTLRCLASIGLDDTSVAYEVIVVDDASSEPDVLPELRAVEGIRLLALEENVGYVRANNAAAAAARGEFLVLLNNDVQVTGGWLDALVARVRSDPTIGLVGARLVYPNGRLQEAGGIIWRDGTGWNYGNGQAPFDAEYRFSRDVDYCSAACVLIRKPSDPLFDERYAPAYFEDVDLAFRLREAGQRVVYEPRAIVIHDEGVSHGRDVDTGVKRHQVINRHVFVERWRHELERQYPPDAHLVPQARDRRLGPHVLVVDETLPTPDVDSGSVRCTALLRCLTDLGAPTHFIPSDLAFVERYTTPLEAMGVEVLDSAAATQRFLKALGSDVGLCILARPRVAAASLSKIRRACPKAVVAYDMVDFHALREQRLADVGAPLTNKKAMRYIANVERRCMQEADLIIAVTDEEAALARDLVPGKPVFVLPNIHRLGPRPDRPTAARKDVLFVGSFRHAPNIDAAQLIVNELAPLLQEKLPRTTIRVVGIDPPRELIEAAGPNVTIDGWIQDLAEVYGATRVVIAPLRAGAGMKGKIGEALSLGIPVVTTWVGAEGYGPDADRFLLIAGSPEEMSDAIVRLVQDDDEWLARARLGWDHARQHLSPSNAEARVKELLAFAGIT